MGENPWIRPRSALEVACGVARGLGAPAQPELGEDVGDVVLDGLAREDERSAISWFDMPSPSSSRTSSSRFVSSPIPRGPLRAAFRRARARTLPPRRRRGPRRASRTRPARSALRDGGVAVGGREGPCEEQPRARASSDSSSSAKRARAASSGATAVACSPAATRTRPSARSPRACRSGAARRSPSSARRCARAPASSRSPCSISAATSSSTSAVAPTVSSPSARRRLRSSVVAAPATRRGRAGPTRARGWRPGAPRGRRAAARRRRPCPAPAAAPRAAHGVGVDGGLRRAGRLDGRRELRVGLLPAAEAHEHRAVVRPAQDVQMGGADPAVEPIRGADPLRGALELGGDGADGDRLAARVDGGLRSAPSPPSAPAIASSSSATPSAIRPSVTSWAPSSLIAHSSRSTSPSCSRGVDRLPREHLGAPRVAGLAGHRRPAQRDPPAQRREARLLDEPRGPVHPALRGRDVPEARAVARDQPERDERRLHRLVAAPVRRVRALAQLERPVGLLQPPERGAEAGERLGALLVGQRGLEAVARPRPVACLEGLARRGQRSVGRHDATLRPPTRSATI